MPEKSTIEQLEWDMTRLAELKSQMAEYDKLKQEYEEVRQAVLMGMQALKSKRTEPINGYFAVRQERATIRVVNDREVEDWLRKEGLDADDYKRIDSARFDPIAKVRLKETGEIIPGTQLEITETVTIRKEATNASR